MRQVHQFMPMLFMTPLPWVAIVLLVIAVVGSLGQRSWAIYFWVPFWLVTAVVVGVAIFTWLALKAL